jgi:hypothetical protein
MSKSSAAILHKMARNAKMLGLTVNSESATAVVIKNGSNDLTISYVDASFSPSVVGGVDDSVSPFLGIGAANPGKMKIKSSSTANDNMTDIIDSAVAAQVLAMVENSDASFSATLRGHSDLLGMGQ